MESTKSDVSDSSFTPFTKEERIRQLNDIDKSLNNLLNSAGLAIKTLARSKTGTSSEPSNLEDPREAFKNASNNYLATLNSVDVRLRRHIYGLEEAGIIAADKPGAKKRDGLSADLPESISTDNSLDIGWLNSRSGKVGRDNEAELWGKALGFLTELEKGTGSSENEMQE